MKEPTLTETVMELKATVADTPRLLTRHFVLVAELELAPMTQVVASTSATAQEGNGKYDVMLRATNGMAVLHRKFEMQ